MTPRGIRFTDEQWAAIEQRVADTNMTAGEVVRRCVNAQLSTDATLAPALTPREFLDLAELTLRNWGAALTRFRLERLDEKGKPTSSRALAHQIGIRPDILHHIEHGRVCPTPDEQEKIRKWLTS